MSSLILVQCNKRELHMPRVFVGLKIAPEIASRFTQIAANLKESSVLLIGVADIHLGLYRVGRNRDTGCHRQLERVAARFAAFPLVFLYVAYGPQPKGPRLLWADCAPTDEFASFTTNAPTSLWANG